MFIYLEITYNLDFNMGFFWLRLSCCCIKAPMRSIVGQNQLDNGDERTSIRLHYTDYRDITCPKLLRLYIPLSLLVHLF